MFVKAFFMDRVAPKRALTEVVGGRVATETSRPTFWVAAGVLSYGVDGVNRR